MAKKQRARRDRRTGSIWEPVNLSPEQIALACMQGPPKKEWDYLSGGKRSQSDGSK